VAATTIATNFQNFEQVAAAKQAQELLTFRDHLLAASTSSSDQTLKVTLLL